MIKAHHPTIHANGLHGRSRRAIIDTQARQAFVIHRQVYQLLIVLGCLGATVALTYFFWSLN